MNNNLSFLKGTIYITDDLQLVRSVPDRTVKIISLDEENRISPNEPNVIVGTCLLPPMEALIAEADGDEDLYDIYYINHLNDPYIQEFIGVIISALYKGISLLLYAPMMKENIFVSKLKTHLWALYGIGIGIPGGEQCQYDSRCIPIWLNMMYFANVISFNEFLLYYPENAQLSDAIANKLIADIKPVAESYSSRINELRIYQQKLKKNPRVQTAIFDMRMK